MKTDLASHKKKLASKAEALLPHLLVLYPSGDLETLGRICQCVCELEEYFLDDPKIDDPKKTKPLIEYLNGKYRDQIVLILSNDNNYFDYTLRYIVQFVRGESVHAKSIIRDKKRETLHNYVFEKDDKIEWEFIVSWSAVSGPNLRSSTGNIDGGGPIRHEISLNENKRTVTAFESITIAGVFEFWQIATNASQRGTDKVFIQFSPADYEQVWGKELCDKLASQLQQYGFIPLPSAPASDSA